MRKKNFLRLSKKLIVFLNKNASIRKRTRWDILEILIYITQSLTLLYLTAANFDAIPKSEFIILALAIAIDLLFLAPLSRNATPSDILLVGLLVFLIML